MLSPLHRDYHATLRAFIDNCLPEIDSVELRRWALQMMTRSSVDDAVDLIRSREHILPTSEAPIHSLPALLIHGDKDHIVPLQSSQRLAERLPNAELHVLPGLGHVPICTAAAQVAALIDGFGKRLSLTA